MLLNIVDTTSNGALKGGNLLKFGALFLNLVIPITPFLRLLHTWNFIFSHRNVVPVLTDLGNSQVSLGHNFGFRNGFPSHSSWINSETRRF